MKKEFDIVNEKNYIYDIENDSDIIRKSKEEFYENICRDSILIYE